MKIQILFLILSLTNFVFSQEFNYGVIRGIVTDKVTKQPLLGANVLILDNNQNIGASTNDKGFFEIKNVPVGSVKLRFSMVGYKSIIKSDVVVQKASPVYISVELEPTVLELRDEVIVKGEYFYKPIDAVANVHNYSAEEIRRAAGSFGDISRMIQSFSGVITNNDLRNDILVRGGNSTENLFLVDGFELQTINHFSTQGGSGGAIGFLQTDFLRETDFYPGGFSAKYGGRLSAVMDVKLKEANFYDRKFLFDLGTAGAGFIYDGPLLEKTAFLFNVRRSYLELFSAISNTWGAIPKYTNFTLKLTYNISPKLKLNFLSLGGFDNILFKDDPNLKEDERPTEQVENKQRNFLIGINLQIFHNPNSVSNFYLSSNYNYYFYDVYDLFDFPGKRLANNKAIESLNSFKYDLTYVYSRNIIIDIGTNFKLKTINQRTYFATDTSNISQVIILNEADYSIDKSIILNETYFNTLIKMLPQLSGTFGLRTYYNNFLRNKSTIDFRSGLSYNLFEDFKINISFGTFSQMPELAWLFTPNSENRHLLYLKSTHYVLGFEYLPFEATKVSLEFYYKTYRNYPVSNVFKFFSLINSGENFGSNIWFDIVSSGKARSYGFDFSIHQKLAKKLYGLFSYSTNRSFYTPLDGKERRTSYDIPHSFNFVGGYIFSKGFEAGLKIKYTTGQPVMPLNEQLSAIKNKSIFDETRYNEVRNPDYFRIDLKLLWRNFYVKSTLTSGIEFFNITNRKNVFLRIWNKRTKQIQYIYQYSFFIGGFINYEF